MSQVDPVIPAASSCASGSAGRLVAAARGLTEVWDLRHYEYRSIRFVRLAEFAAKALITITLGMSITHRTVTNHVVNHSPVTCVKAHNNSKEWKPQCFATGDAGLTVSTAGLTTRVKDPLAKLAAVPQPWQEPLCRSLSVPCQPPQAVS